jgi:hypothetical protein
MQRPVAVTAEVSQMFRDALAALEHAAGEVADLDPELTLRVQAEWITVARLHRRRGSKLAPARYNFPHAPALPARGRVSVAAGLLCVLRRVARSDGGSHRAPVPAR